MTVDPVPDEPVADETVPDEPVPDEPPKTNTLARASSMLFDQSKYLDHCSLSLPSSQIRFRGTSKARVYSDERGQFIIEEHGDETIVKRVDTFNPPLKLLRALYTLVAVFWTGFLIVVSIELLIYLILYFTIAVGVTNKQEEPNFGQAMGVLLAMPLCVYGMASCLVLAGYFVSDTWGGHLLVKQFISGRMESVLTDWIAFWLFLGVPLFTMIGAILSKQKEWWEITSLVWLVSISIAFTGFSVTVVYYEFRAHWEVTTNRYDDNDDSWWPVTKRAILLRQRHVFGGNEHATYLLKGKMDNEANNDCRDSIEGDRLNVFRMTQSVQRQDVSSGKSWYCSIISLQLFQTLGMFVPTREQQYTMGDVQDARVFVTRQTWSLESVYCRPRHSRYVAVVGGPHAITQEQIRSSLACAILSNVIILLFAIAFIVWMNLSGVAVVVVLILCVLGLYPTMMQSYRLYKMKQNLKEELKVKEGRDNNNDNNSIDSTTNNQSLRSTLSPHESEGIFQVFESHRVITLTEPFCWVIFAMEVIILFLWPLASLITLQNAATTVLFCVIACFSSLRAYFNAAIVLEETGNMDLVNGERGTLTYWQNKSRLNTIVTKVTRSHAKSVWMTILIGILIILLSMGIMSVKTTVDGENAVGRDYFVTFLPDYEYQANEEKVTYPTCSFGKDSVFGRRDLADYAFLSSLGYANDSIAQSQLDQWFSFDNEANSYGNVTTHPSKVTQFRESIRSESPVVYRLITFPTEEEQKEDAMVVIRGSVQTYDFLIDAQLWMAAILFQCLRFVLPLGHIWTPILHRLIKAISFLESGNLEKVSFYSETTAFIQWLQQNPNMTNIQTAGHSLGGGLAFISAAQTNIPGIGVSAPNAMLSRDSFEPPLSATSLNELTFNVIPDIDIVPRSDDVAQNYQHIRCLANTGSYLGDAMQCHGSGLRSLCELLVKCGTQNRPALCECHYQFGYPKPTPRNSSGTNNAADRLDKQCAPLIERMKMDQR